MPRLPTESEQLAVIKKAITLTLKQGTRSVSPIGTCMYRSPDGLKCAVGQLISEEHYSGGIEGSGVHDTDVNNALLKSLGFVVDADLTRELNRIQLAHDAATDYSFGESFVNTLKEKPSHYPLITKALKELNL